MNLIPSIRAYIAQRIADLKNECGAIAFARSDELQRLDSLCQGLEKQAEILEAMINRTLNEREAK